MHDTFNSFLSDLKGKGKQSKTISTYESVLRQFALWVEETTGEAFHPEDVTPIDAAEYRRYSLERSRSGVTESRWNYKRYPIFCSGHRHLRKHHYRIEI
ncbi:hypothetical protein ACFO25_19195 [Paenactinomyces guangxiensis]|uniref:Core-binding (CB) domain-containing protein n=1 Tax=Paenactinomyces guangxiensis TaxID=1490290 RepID=A0A7W2A9M7_9BACL|nr:hypothetical protein [Paenactinomyces guangxiensis]MBA4495439.1 hypothetical protein [Paenactinomyces guangxiensis]MBH8592440.1 hypothetical protein [Paenactinomyces guangxiensis]